MGWRGWWPEVVLVVLSAISAPVLHATVFPDGSADVDEVGYLSQADALAHGRLTLEADDHAPSFLPFLAAVDGDRVVFKYQPLWPAVLTATRAATGSFLPALALDAGLATAAAVALGREATGRRAGGLLTGGVFALCPFVLVHGGTYLGYLPSATLVMAALATVLGAERTGASRLWLLAGALIGLTLFHRTFDGVLLAIAILVWMLVGSRTPGALRHLRLLVLGALPLAVLLLAHNAVVTGSPFTPAFTVSNHGDTFGFGRHSSIDVPLRSLTIDYTPAAAWSAFLSETRALSRWLLGGVGLCLLAAVGALHGWRDGRLRLVTATVLMVPVGYFFWWGNANMVAFGLHLSLGPFYWLPIVGPMCALAVAGALRLTAARPPHWLIGSAAVLLLLTAVQLPSIADDVGASADLRTALSDLERPPVENGLTLVGPKFPGDLYSESIVPYDLDAASRLVARDPLGSTARFDLLDRFRGRRTFIVRRVHAFDAPLDATHALREELLDCVTPSWALSGRYRRAAGADELTPYVRIGEDVREQVRRATPVIATRIDADDLPVDSATEVALGVLLGSSTVPVDERDAVELRWDVVATADGQVRVLGPPAGWHRSLHLNGRRNWSQEVLGRRLTTSSPNSAC